MESIKAFEIEVDISDRDLLYDYGRAEWIRRPVNGDWDLIALQERVIAKLDEEDEMTLARVATMDKVFEDEGFSEVKHKDDEEKEEEEEIVSTEVKDDTSFGSTGSLQPSQELPLRVLPVYKPGELIKGHLVLENLEPLKAEQVRVNFRGSAIVRIRKYHHHGFYDEHGEEDYVNEDITIWEKTDDIPPGLHRFPFEFVVPTDARCPCPNFMKSLCDYGYLVYRLKAKIYMGHQWGYGNIITHKGIWVVPPVDIANCPEDLEPVTSQEVLEPFSMLGKKGKLTCSVTLPRRAFIRGTSVPVSADIENMTLGEVAKVSCKVAMQGKCRTGEGAFRSCRAVYAVSAGVREGKVDAGMCPHFEWTIPLDFSAAGIDSNLIPTGSFDDCTLIDIEYVVRIKLKRKGLHRDVELDVPIKIGTEDSSKIPELTK